MYVIIITIVTIGLLVYSIRSVSNFFLANIALVLFLPTIDRLAGGFDFGLEIIKYPVLFLGFVFHFFNAELKIKTNLLFILSAWAAFIFVLKISSLFFQNATFFEALTLSGLSFIPLMILAGAKTFNFEKFSIDLINYIFLPIALFGIIQYILGPDFFQNIGFSLITPNTTTTYSRTFSVIIENEHMGIRPFSFLVSSADYAAVMFHAVLWVYILKPKDSVLIMPRKLILLLLIIALLISQFITIILLSIFGIFLYHYKRSGISVSINNSIKLLFISSFILLSTYVLLPDIFNRIIDSITFYRPSDGEITSLGYRILYILKYPTLIKGHVLWGYGYMLDYSIFSADAKILYFSLFTGIPLMVLYLLFLILLINSCNKKVKISHLEENIKDKIILASVILVAIIINDFSNGHIEATSPSNYLVWVIVGNVISIK